MDVLFVELLKSGLHRPSWSTSKTNDTTFQCPQRWCIFSIGTKLHWRASCNWSTRADAISVCMLCTSSMHPYFVNFLGIECTQLPCWPLLSHLRRELFAKLSRLTVEGCGVRFQWKDDGQSTNTKIHPLRIKSINQSHVLDGFEFWLNLMLQNRSSWRFQRIWVEHLGGTPWKLTEKNNQRADLPKSPTYVSLWTRRPLGVDHNGLANGCHASFGRCPSESSIIFCCCCCCCCCCGVTLW